MCAILVILAGFPAIDSTAYLLLAGKPAISGGRFKGCGCAVYTRVSYLVSLHIWLNLVEMPFCLDAIKPNIQINVTCSTNLKKNNLKDLSLNLKIEFRNLQMLYRSCAYCLNDRQVEPARVAIHQLATQGKKVVKNSTYLQTRIAVVFYSGNSLNRHTLLMAALTKPLFNWFSHHLLILLSGQPASQLSQGALPKRACSQASKWPALVTDTISAS